MNKHHDTEPDDILELDPPEEARETLTCPKCGHDRDESATECVQCGVVFAKLERTPRPPKPALPVASFPYKPPFFSRKNMSELLLHVNPESGMPALVGRLVLLLLMMIWAVRFLTAPIADNAAGNSFLHLINLPFHEAGHVIFRPLGRFMTSLGGSLFQLIVPMVCCLVLLLKTRDTFGAAVCFWWFGENFLDLAPYINDARALVLPLVGGNTGRFSPYGFHDWQFILTESGLLNYDHAIATGAAWLGGIIMITACCWCLILIMKQYQFIKHPHRPM